ncbi:MAG TPA: hypothetical protein VMZ25_01940 [Terriglobales bacterium]|nr:hypothetical protein [Terriglobales bacterium]
MRLDQAAGLFKDDGWYTVMAKAIATGQGLTLINFPVGGGVYFYPPIFPLLLSPVFAISDFPQNVWLLKSVSIIAIFLAGWLTYRLLMVRAALPPTPAMLVAFCVVLGPSWVFLATSTVMSECVYLAFQVAALFAAERALSLDRISTGTIVFIAFLATLSYLTRSAGIVVIITIALTLAKDRLYRAAFIFILAFAFFVTPWTLYKRHLIAQAPAAIQNKLPKGYLTQTWQRAAGTDSQDFVTIRDLPLRFIQNTMVITTADTGALLLPAVYRTAAESGEEVIDLTNVAWVPRDFIGWGKGTMGNAFGTKLLSLVISLTIIGGFLIACQARFGLLELFSLLFLATIVIWPGPTYRYLLPLSPLLFYYFALGVKGALSSLEAGATDPWMFARAALLCIISLFLYDHAGYISARRQPLTEPSHPEWLRKYEASKAAAEWIRAHTAEKEVIAGDNLPMTYLYSGRKTDKCAPHACAKLGLRYYLRQQDIYDFPAEDIRYQSPIYNQVRVAELK